MRKTLSHWLWTIVAAIFLFEAWLWDILGGALARLVDALPIEPLRRVLKRAVNRLPAIFAFALFVVPVLVILPFKFAALALLAQGKVILGGGVFLAAKAAGLGVTAFLFDVCRNRLMTLRWFAIFYGRVIAFRTWAHDLVEPYRVQLRQEIAQLRSRVAAFLGRDGAPSIVARLAHVRAQIRDRAKR
jgi:hypothetical protein